MAARPRSGAFLANILLRVLVLVLAARAAGSPARAGAPRSAAHCAMLGDALERSGRVCCEVAELLPRSLFQ